MVYPKIKSESLFTFFLVKVIGYHQLSGYQHSPKKIIIIFCVQYKKKKKPHTGLSQHEGNEDLIFTIS